MPNATATPSERQSLLANGDIRAVVSRIVGKSGGHWQAAHSEVLSELRSRADDEVGAIVEPVERELSELQNWRSTTTTAVSQTTTDARNELEELRSRVEGLDREELPSSEELETPARTDWLVLLTLVAVFVAVEAGGNMMLLAPALETGLVGALVTAVLVSVVNVGALGTGFGLILFQMKRLAAPRLLFLLSCAGIGALALFFNLIVGRHRESFERLIEMREAQGPQTDVSLTSARQLAEEISLNPVDWELRSFLFFVLGLALCAVGLYKGYTFFRTRLPAALRRRNEAMAAIQEQYQGLSKRRRDGLRVDLETKVTERVVRLDRSRHESRRALDNLVGKWNQGAHLSMAESVFVMEHDTRFPDKVRHEMLVEHRSQPGVAPMPLDPGPALDALDQADRFVASWNEEGDREFSEGIARGIREINEDWTRYRPMINRPLAEHHGPGRAGGAEAGEAGPQPGPGAP